MAATTTAPAGSTVPPAVLDAKAPLCVRVTPEYQETFEEVMGLRYCPLDELRERAHRIATRLHEAKK